MTSKALARKAAGAMLLVQARTEKAAERVLKDGSASVAAHVDANRDRNRRDALIATIVMFSPMIVGKLRGTLTTGRQEARKVSGKRLLAELSSLGISVSESDLGVGRPGIAAAAVARLKEDEAMSSFAADSLLGQWRSVMLHDSAKALRDGKSAASAVRGTGSRMTGRIERTASTEIARAYNEEHRALIEDAARYGSLKDDLEDAGVVREWSALIDACERCWPHDGEQAALDDSFSGGDVPGEVHVRCRCIEMLVTGAQTQKKAA